MPLTQADIINIDQSWYDSAPGEHAQGRNGARKLKNSDGQMAFFKVPKPHILGNEVLAYVLASHLGLPCAKVKFADLFESEGSVQKGILSFRITGIELMEWPLLPTQVTQNLARYVMNSSDIGKIAVFDVWSYNVDRGTSNLVVSPKEEWPNKYLIYMIDHEECFYGFNEVCNRHEADGVWGLAERFITMTEIKSVIRFSQVEEFIGEIEAISNDDLRAMISLIPQDYYNPNQAETIFNILQKRRDSLRVIIRDWCTRENQL